MHQTHRLLLFTLALVGLTLDQVSKYTVFHWLRETPHRYEVLPDYCELVAQRVGGETLHVNQGALFGLGQRLGATANSIFAAISLLAAGVIVFWAMLPSTARDRQLCISLGLIFAGTLGNLYDRVVFGGVRDFLHFFIDRGGERVFDWPVFNVADCCLVLGAGLLLIQAFQSQPSADNASVGTTPVVATPSASAHCVSIADSE
jgi:signal peptidase II